MPSRLYLSTLFIFCFSFASSADDAHPAIKQAREVKRVTSDVVSELVKLALDEADSSGSREVAIHLLGELRSQDAVEPLLRILLTRGLVRFETGPLSAYPAAQALSSMGSLVYDDAWGRVAREQSDKYLYVLAFTMVQIDGQPIAALRVKEKLKEVKIDPLKVNLQRLLKVLETTDFKDPNRWPT